MERGSVRASAPVLNSQFEETGADVSADGRWLACASDVNGADEVYVRRLDAPTRTVSEPVLVSTAAARVRGGAGTGPSCSTSDRRRAARVPR